MFFLKFITLTIRHFQLAGKLYIQQNQINYIILISSKLQNKDLIEQKFNKKEISNILLIISKLQNKKI
jgi:hypothetical protein